MENIKLTEEAIEKAAEQQKASNKMILSWAEKQGRGIIQQMELNKHPLTLSLSWQKVKQGWLGGFVSGVSAGFQLGYKTAHKLTDGFVNGIEAVVVGTEAAAIERRNAELKTMLGEAIGEASMCWATPEAAGTFDSTKAEAIVARLYERFSTPVPAVQQRLPGL